VQGTRNAYKETSVQKNLNKVVWKRKHTREVKKNEMFLLWEANVPSKRQHNKNFYGS
jgi:hypothetical protein